MIVNREFLELEGKPIFDRIRFTLPLKIQGNMQAEACFYLSNNAEGSLFSLNEKIELTAKEALLMRCGNYVRHLNRNIQNEEVSEMLLIHFYPGVLEQLFKDDFEQVFSTENTSNPPHSFVEKVKMDDVFDSFIQSIHHYLDHPMLASEGLIQLKLKELIMLLIKADRTGSVKSTLLAFFDFENHDFKAIIKTHLFNDISTNDLAFLCNMSVSSFQRKFKKVFHESPAKYIKTQRLLKASELLKHTEKSISEIAYDTGFSSPNYFSKCFHEVYGCAPSEVR